MMDSRTYWSMLRSVCSCVVVCVCACARRDDAGRLPVRHVSDRCYTRMVRSPTTTVHRVRCDMYVCVFFQVSDTHSLSLSGSLVSPELALRGAASCPLSRYSLLRSCASCERNRSMHHRSPRSTAKTLNFSDGFRCSTRTTCGCTWRR